MSTSYDTVVGENDATLEKLVIIYAYIQAAEHEVEDEDLAFFTYGLRLIGDTLIEHDENDGKWPEIVF